METIAETQSPENIFPKPSPLTTPPYPSLPALPRLLLVPSYPTSPFVPPHPTLFCPQLVLSHCAPFRPDARHDLSHIPSRTAAPRLVPPCPAPLRCWSRPVDPHLPLIQSRPVPLRSIRPVSPLALPDGFVNYNCHWSFCSQGRTLCSKE